MPTATLFFMLDSLAVVMVEILGLQKSKENVAATKLAIGILGVLCACYTVAWMGASIYDASK
jgi:hypothetical protein